MYNCITIQSYEKHVGNRNPLPNFQSCQNIYCNLQQLKQKCQIYFKCKSSSTSLNYSTELMHYINDQHYYVNRAHQNILISKQGLFKLIHLNF